jgi:DNA-binding GntR family transcriptional regulator
MIRSKLEGLCASWACEHITKEQLEEMEENIYLAKFHAEKSHFEQMSELDSRFHEIMYEACNSKMLEHLLKDFHQYVQRVRRKTLSTIERSLASNSEHQAIMEAIRDNNPERADELATLHIHNAYENMVKNGLKEAYLNE